MPLPGNGTAWPPKALTAITPTLAQWDAWYIGEPAGLEAAYRRGGTSTAPTRPSQLRGGVVGALARMFWGRPNPTPEQPQHKLHVPIATDLCQASADLIYSEAPTITVDDQTTQDRLDVLVDDGLLQVLAEAAEIGSALGGSFLRVTWDTTLAPDGPFLTKVDADAALPEFRWGRLVAVTFWHQVRVDGSKVWRHLERHELDAFGVGVIAHGLYEGTPDNLGHAVPLTDADATAGLADVVDERSQISTESPGLAVAYVPNQRPQRQWRKDPLGQHLGRSDLDGVEPLMDSLDEVYSSWMRDIRLAKARLLVAANALEDNGPGNGVTFDADREVYAPLNAPPGSLANANLIAQAEQFKIRHEEHRATAADLLEQILRTAGYSPATFGLGGDGAAMTATEVTARYGRSLQTRGRKLRAIRPALSTILEKLLAVDDALFGTPGVKVSRPKVEFPDGVQESPLSLAQTAQALRTAEAASTRTLVEMLHPEWDDEQVSDEVAAIGDESAMPILPDPADPEVIPGATVEP